MNAWTITAQAVRNPALQAQIVHRADREFPFLHDTMVVQLGGRLLTAWYNCSEDEIVGRTVIRGRWSQDGGATWSAPEIICEDDREGYHMVPVTFSEYDGQIWAYVTRMTAHDRPVGYVCAAYDGARWQIRSEREAPVLLNTLPQKTEGRWIVGGRMSAARGELPLIPIVALAAPGAPAEWTIVKLPGPWNRGEYPLQFPETALLVERNRVDALVRNDAGPMGCFTSLNGGQSWSEMRPCSLPIAPAKMYGGTLPDGRQYLIYNELTARKDRSRLVLALRDGPEKPFTRAWLLADGYDEAIEAGPYWHYPCACTADGRLYVSCTASGQGVVRHAALFTVPLDAI